jgi:hypothetical protein
MNLRNLHLKSVSKDKFPNFYFDKYSISKSKSESNQAFQRVLRVFMIRDIPKGVQILTSKCKLVNYNLNFIVSMSTNEINK